MVDVRSDADALSALRRENRELRDANYRLLGDMRRITRLIEGGAQLGSDLAETVELVHNIAHRAQATKGLQ